MHGVALVEAGAQNDKTLELAAEDGGGGVARAGIAEHAERELVIFRKHPLGAQRRRHRDRPALGHVQQPHRRGIVLDPGADQKGNRSFARDRR